MKIRVLPILISVLALFACDKTIDPEISLAEGTAVMDRDGGTAVVSLSCNCDWTAETGVEGVLIDPAAGNGDASVTVTVPANEDGETKSIRITFTAQGTEKTATAKFVITQAARPFVLFPVASGTLPAAGGGLRILLESNDEWVATTSPTGISVTPESGTNSQTLAVSAGANTTGEPVVHTITVSLRKDSTVKTTYTLTQSN